MYVYMSDNNSILIHSVITCVQFDGQKIASASVDRTIKVWSLKTNAPWSVLTLLGHIGGVRCLQMAGNMVWLGMVWYLPLAPRKHLSKYFLILSSTARVWISRPHYQSKLRPYIIIFLNSVVISILFDSTALYYHLILLPFSSSSRGCHAYRHR